MRGSPRRECRTRIGGRGRSNGVQDLANARTSTVLPVRASCVKINPRQRRYTTRLEKRQTWMTQLCVDTRLPAPRASPRPSHTAVSAATSPPYFPCPPTRSPPRASVASTPIASSRPSSVSASGLAATHSTAQQRRRQATRCSSPVM